MTGIAGEQWRAYASATSISVSSPSVAEKRIFRVLSVRTVQGEGRAAEKAEAVLSSGLLFDFLGLLSRSFGGLLDGHFAA